MHRIAIAALVALFMASAGVAQERPNLPEVVTKKQERFLKILGPPAFRDAARGIQEVLFQVDEFAPVDGWEQVGETVHTYTGARRHLTVRRAGDPGFELQVQSRTERTYDGLGRLAQRRHDQAAGDSFIPSDREVLTYVGSQPAPTQILYQYYLEEQWVNSEREVLTLAGDGWTITGGQIDEWDGEGWIPYERFTIEEVGADIHYTIEFWNGSGWQNDERIQIPAFSLADLTDLLRGFELFIEDFGDLFLTAAQLPDALYEFWTGTEWEPESRQVTEVFTGPGGVISRIEKTMEAAFDDEWVPELRFVLTYDLNEDPYVDMTEFQFPDEDEWFSLFIETYTHSDTGRLATAELAVALEDEIVAGRGALMPLALYTYSWQEVATTSEGAAPGVAVRLDSVYPNPVRDAGVVSFVLQAGSPVVLALYDILGRRVLTLADATFPAGEHDVRLDAGGLPSGLYVVRLESDGGTLARRLTVVR
jgi:hypothetical protein